MWKIVDHHQEGDMTQKVRHLLKSYVKHIILVFIFLTVIDLGRLLYCIGWYKIITFSKCWHEFFRILSITCGVVAVSAHPGWGIQTWSGNTIVEQWNNRIILITRIRH